MRPLTLPPSPAPSITRRRLLLGTAAAAAAACSPLRGPTGSPGPASQPGTTPPSSSTSSPRLRLIGETTLAHRLTFRNTTVGGLSALDYDPASGLWYALSDDRSDLQPARFYTLRLSIGLNSLAAPALLDVVTLRQPDGTPYPRRGEGIEVPDPEAMRWRPQTGTLLWTSEGDGRAGLDPFVREVRPDGSHLRAFSLPPMFAMKQPRPGQGPRDNLTFEGLALTPDGAGAWVSMEAPLKQDGPLPAYGVPGGPCRFTLFDVASGRALRQIAYQPDTIPQPSVPAGAHADNGVSEILMLDAQRMLVLERAYMTGVGTSLRLYLIDTQGNTGDTTDTLALPRLIPDNHRPAAKTLVADFARLGLARLDNTEGMCWGPRLPGGGRSLVFVSDDNFNPRQVTQFVAFEFLT